MMSAPIFPRMRSSLCVLAVLAACRGHEAGPLPAPPVVTIAASDAGFDAPDTIPSGLVTLHLVTRGAEMHQAALARIGSGHTLAQFLDAMRAPPPPPDWVEMAGGVEPPAPGDSASVTLTLAPGRYAILDLIPGADGVPHVVKGMYRELIVAPSRARPAVEPVATDSLTLADGAFVSSAPLATGTRMLRVVNSGTRPHEVTIVRLAQGKSASDLLHWLAHPAGPPPGTMLGGVFGLRPGEHAYVPALLTPGEYAIFCSLGAGPGVAPWFARGMLREVTVR